MSEEKIFRNVLIGPRFFGVTSKVVIQIWILDENNQKERELNYAFNKNWKGLRVGFIYKFEFGQLNEEKASIYTGT